MNGQEIIDNFRLLNDEQDDLSAVERLALAQEVIDIILNQRDWLFLVKTASGNLDTTNTEFTLPTDFRKLTPNWHDDNGTPQRILYIGADFDRYKWIDMQQRRNVRDAKGFAYIDFRQSKFVLTTLEDTVRSYEFDYIHNAVDITIVTSPVIPDHFHKAIPKFMVVLWTNIDQTDKSFSYALENNRDFQDYIDTMAVQEAEHYNQMEV